MRIVVYCSGRADIDRSWIEDTERLGAWIGAGGDTLVYGGVALGLMKVLAESTRGAGGRTVGVVPIKRISSEDRGDTINIHVGDLNSRKATMMQLADVFVALPGGYGTLDEIVSTMTSLGFNDDKRKMIVLNSEKLYEPLRLQYYSMIEHGLLEPTRLRSLIFVDSLDGVLEALAEIKESIE